MNVAIIGTAGIPACYGGFETLAEYLTKFLGFKLNMTVYCSTRNYKIKQKKYNNANLKYIPLNANGLQSIIYDAISLFHAASSNDIIFIFGVSGGLILPIFRLFYPSKKLIINIDGLEHKRSKWKSHIQKFLKLSEKLAVKYCNIIISDNKAIQKYIKEEYNKNSNFIAYGGNQATAEKLSEDTLTKYKIPNKYAFKLCRIEPENNVELILHAFSITSFPLVIIGNWENNLYGNRLKKEYGNHKNIILLNPIYEQNELDQIRSNCTFYIHGHSAGGTNPSLVEAMNLGLPIIAYDVIYNRETTQNKALYFKNTEDLIYMIHNIYNLNFQCVGREMKIIAEKNYKWEYISKKYFELLQHINN